jgi:hypothetical protein
VAWITKGRRGIWLLISAVGFGSDGRAASSILRQHGRNRAPMMPWLLAVEVLNLELRSTKQHYDSSYTI